MAWWLFQNIVTTAALVAAVMLICRFTRIGPVARHALWVLVLVKFVMPPLVTWPWSAPDPLNLAAATTDSRNAAPTVRVDVESAGNIPIAVTDPSSEQPAVAATLAPTPAAPPHRLSLAPVALLLWGAGSLCLLIIESIRLARLARRIRSAIPAPPQIGNRLRELAVDLGVTAPPALMVGGITSPVIFCVGRPRLLWPVDLQLGSTEEPASAEPALSALIVHELAHLKRRDHIVGWLELAAGVIWWWNPLFWYARFARREQAELACDAWVISTLPNGRRAYAESLLVLSTLPAGPAPSMMAATVGVRASSRRVLERRLVMIMKGRAPLRLPWKGLLTIAVMAAATLPAWASSGQQATTPKPAQEPTRVTSTHAPAPAQAKPVTTAQKPVTTQTPPATAVTVIHEGKPQTVHVQPTASVPAHATTIPRTNHVTVMPVQEPGKVWIAQNWKMHGNADDLPADGQKLVKSFDSDRDAIQEEMKRKIDARKEALMKELQALQDQYARAGKLDEAIAIRDFIRSGGPDNEFFTWIKR